MKNNKPESLLISNIINHFYLIDEISEVINEEDFLQIVNKHIYKVLKELNFPKEDRKISYEYIKSKLDENIVNKEIWESYDFSNKDDIDYLINEIKNTSDRKKLYDEFESIKQELVKNNNLEDINKKIEDVITPLILRNTKIINAKKIDECLNNIFDEIENKSKIDSYITGINTGFVDLNIYTNGFQKTDLILIAARPSMGKTAFSLNLCNNMAHSDKKILFISLEMSANQLMHRLLAINSNVEISRIRNGKLSESEWDLIINAGENLYKKDIFINDLIEPDVEKIIMHAKKMKKDEDIDVIIIDYLQLINVKGKENRNNEIGYITRRLKSLAKELDVPILLISQLSRAVESRMDKRPLLSDLRESGAIEQDADIVMFLYREAYYNKKATEKDKTELIISKHRNGQVGTVNLRFNERTTFVGNY